MALQYVGGQKGSFAGKTGATTVTFSLAGGLASVPAAGDVVVVSYGVGSASSDRALTIQNGSAVDYTLVGTELFQADTFSSNLRVAYRVMPGTPETTCVLSGTGSNADAGAYTIHVYRGVDTTTPLDVAAVTDTGANTRLANPPAITPITTGAWIHIVGSAACGTGGTFTAAYLTDLQVTTQADTNDVNIASGYVAWTSGAYDPAAFGGGGTDTTNDSWTALTFALRPLATAALTGTVTASVTEANIVAGGKTLIITLTGDKWLAAGAASFDLQRQNIINGCTSAQSESTGWNLIPKALQGVAGVVRTSDTVVTITWDAFSTYNITAQETITVTVPASALVNNVAVVSTPTFTVDTVSSFNVGWAYNATTVAGQGAI